MIDRKTWKEFQDTKMLWWINRILHTFGWAIVCEMNSDDKISDVYPARVKFRGFSEADEENGFIGLTDHMSVIMEDLKKEARS